MPQRYNTGNSRPSNSMKDLNDNALAFDDFMNSESDTFIDRFGDPKDSLPGTTKKIMLAADDVIEATRQNLIPLSRQYMTLADAQADIANIPEGSTTYYRSPDDSSLAVEVINNAGTLQPTGRKMPSQDYIDQKTSGFDVDIKSLNETRTEEASSLYSTYVDTRGDTRELVIAADKELRKIAKIDLIQRKLVIFGNNTPYQSEVDEAKMAGGEIWQYNGNDSNIIILLADAAGRLVRYLNLTEQTEYLFGKKVGSDTISYTPPESWPEFIDNRSYGQSLSVSFNPGNSGPGIPTDTNGALMWNVGIQTYNSTNINSFITIPTTASRQYQEQSYIHQLQFLGVSDSHIHFAAASGVPGYSMAQLKPGTEPWSQLMSNIEQTALLAQSQGMQYGMPVIDFNQGEADAFLGRSISEYSSDQVIIQDGINRKVKEVARTDYDVAMFIYQMASHGRYEGQVHSSSQIPLAQLASAQSNPLIQLITPMYIFPYADGVHLTNHGYRWFGVYRAKAVKYWMDTGKPWKPLYPTKVFKVGDKTVVAEFNVPVGPLQFRNDIVPEHPSGAKGFELWEADTDGNLTRLNINSVQLVGGDKVKVISESSFNGAVYLAYGFTPINRGDSDGAGRYPSWNAGVNSGVCGNLCDSDNTITDLLDANGEPYQLKNYCCIFYIEAI
ncbi:hypothetical protein [Klebsiella pneumoniae]|uniref:hypothetical protein n=2 Tax=Klebsiella pneumoniae TaxID=573 RepID=UPI0025AA0651|nr:hypothetical protein [Klebsiella pneumoniae]